MDQLSVAFDYQDKWPTRIAEFIVNLSEWYAAHPNLSDFSAHDIATFLVSVFDNQFVRHESCIFTIERDPAGKTFHCFNSFVRFDDLCRALAMAAFERYALSDFILSHSAIPTRLRGHTQGESDLGG